MATNLIYDNLLQSVISLRKELHSQPEISEHEVITAKKIKTLIDKLHPTRILEGVGGTGLIVEYDSGLPGKNIMFRAELDALPIQEINTFSHQSLNKGVSHKCGHDGHMSVLYGLANLLMLHPIKTGKVYLLFQPAEENGVGANAIIKSKEFKELSIDYIFAFHNLPGYELNQIVYRKNAFTASVKSIIIKLNGKTSHAAEPEHGINPSAAISEINQQLLSMEDNNIQSDNFSVITPIYFTLGEKSYGISAGYGECHYTIRTWNKKKMDHLTKTMVNKITSIAHKYHLELQIEWTQEFDANENNEDAVNQIVEVAKESNLNIVEREFPFKWGEDFGAFTQIMKGAMFGIGSGENCPALHNPDYDYPDEISPIAIQLFYDLILKNQ